MLTFQRWSTINVRSSSVNVRLVVHFQYGDRFILSLFLSLPFSLFFNLFIVFMENSAGIGLVKRKLANSSYPTVEFTKDENDNFIFKSHTIIKTSETRFRLGEEFDEDRLDGKRVKVSVESVLIWIEPF